MKDKTAEFILSPMCPLFGGSTVVVHILALSRGGGGGGGMYKRRTDIYYSVWHYMIFFHISLQSCRYQTV